MWAAGAWLEGRLASGAVAGQQGADPSGGDTEAPGCLGLAHAGVNDGADDDFVFILLVHNRKHVLRQTPELCIETFRNDVVTHTGTIS